MPDELRDTIAAIATPPGRGGIGILRLSGPDALTIAAPLLRLHAPLEPNRARFCEIIDPTTTDFTRTDLATATKLDEAIATFFKAPKSYTGEDVLEIAAHGSPVLLDFLLRQCVSNGARLANPGEFTERAFLAGRLDLTQAEAVRDLIDAQTLYQARIAASQLDGALSRRVAPIKAALIHLIAQLEAGIDFAEDDTPTLTAAAILEHAAPIAEQLDALAHSFEHGRLVHSGLTLAIVGEPNVGKSSLFNRLVERERAIVTATPGTTRDLVTERVSLAGIPIELVDTAGLRQSTPSGPLDEAERLGIAKSREALADADLVLLVLDASHPSPACEHASVNLPSDAPPILAAETQQLLRSLEERHVIVVLNKADLAGPRTQAVATQLAAAITTAPAAGTIGSLASPAEPGPSTEARAATPDGREPHRSLQIPLQFASVFLSSTRSSPPIVSTSALTGEGIAHLRQMIQQQLQTPALSSEGGMLTNIRQHQAVASACFALAAARSAFHLPHEMLLLDLYTALQHLDALTGQTTSDDILNLIFSTFCIGK